MSATARDLENAGSVGFGAEFPLDDRADMIVMGSQGATGRDVGKLVSGFKVAAEDQAGAHQALSERIDRLEQKEDFQSLHETVRDLYEVLSGFVGEMDRQMSQAENRIAAVAQTVEVLEENIASAEARAGQAESAIAQLSDRVRLAEQQIANLADCGVRVGALSKRVSELKEMEKILRELQGQGDQASADICTLSEDIRLLQGGVGSVNTEYRQLKDRIEQAEGGIAASLEQSQSLARLHARLAETYALKTG